MGRDPKAEFLAQMTRLEELIDASTARIEHANALINESRRLIRRIATVHGVHREDNNFKKPHPFTGFMP